MKDETFDEPEKPELCKECQYPLIKEREEREGGYTEFVTYCPNCGETSTLKI